MILTIHCLTVSYTVPLCLAVLPLIECPLSQVLTCNLSQATFELLNERCDYSRCVEEPQVQEAAASFVKQCLC